MKVQLVGASVAVAAILLGAGIVTELNEDGQEREQLDAARLEAAIFADPARAAAELNDRLLNHLSSRAELLIVHDRLPMLPTVYGLPRSATWVVNCDALGLWVEFGSGASEGGSGVALYLTNTALTGEQCDTLVPMVGTKLLALTRRE